MRRVLVQVHGWLGLTVGLLWAVQGLSGAVLSFRHELERIAAPTVSPGAMLPLDALLESATRAAAGARIQRLSIADRHRDRIEAAYAEPGQASRSVLLEAATGRMLGKRELAPTLPSRGSIGQWFLMLHTTLLSGRTGQVFIGISGSLLLSTVIVGLRLAWPARRAWRAAYSWRRWKTRLQRLHGWHRALGLSIGCIILVIAATGISMVFEESLRVALARFVPHQLPYQVAVQRSSVAPIAAQTALDIAQRQVPGAQWVRVTLPLPSASRYTIRFHRRGESAAWMGRTTVVIDAGSGRVESVYDATRAPLSNRMVDALLPLHQGELLGLGGRVLMMLAGLALPVLYATGVWRWLTLRKRSRRAVGA